MVLGENDYTNGKHEGRELVNADQLFEAIEKWGWDKGILPDADPLAQWTKTMEEATELGVAIANKNREEVKDAIGDIIVTVTMQAEAWGLSPQQCMQHAYDIISKRSGKMVDGVFVKDE